MSVVINYVSKYIAIIASDTRINYGQNAEFGYSDDNIKLVNLPNMGWCSGVGYHNFLELFKNKLVQAEVNNPKEIEFIFNESIEQAIVDSMLLDIEDINSSAVSFSWVSITPEDIFCRIGLMSKKHFDNNLMLMNEGEFHIFYPGEYIDNLNLVSQFKETFNLQFQLAPDDPDLLSKLLDRTLSMFNYISNQAKATVSRTCHVGILLLSQQGIYKFRSIVDVDLLEKQGTNISLEQISHTPLNFEKDNQ
ncbi:hypothetical protein [Aneurinibacillus uraniidurans]|uniref:hypothetical protein n=1 Tax=Aneurinibacillus uraniidurans TaxID=2966586 RepID=UPI00234AEA1A|nr:hypothetical protein [Aneurinibacillus sp. B1]WCN36216.1 hypothetical protein PO771_09945 [Aneurinibacillus sp. B1]